MRFLGGGVGHEEHQVEEDLPVIVEEEDIGEEETALVATAQPERLEDEAVSDAEEPEGAYVPSEDEDVNAQERDLDETLDDGEDAGADAEGEKDLEDEEEPDLGPEDGEGDDEVDEYELDQYARY